MANNEKQYATEEQLAYAAWLDIGMKAGLGLLVITFLIYLTGLFTPHVPLQDLPGLWTLSASEYQKATGAPTGWSWLTMIDRGDYLNFIGIAILSLVTVFCYLRILPILLHNKNTPFVVITVLEVLVLVLAASGILAAGH